MDEKQETDQVIIDMPKGLSPEFQLLYVLRVIADTASVKLTPSQLSTLANYFDSIIQEKNIDWRRNGQS